MSAYEAINNLRLYAQNNVSAPIASFTPADMGYGIFNMPVMPINTQGNIWPQFPVQNTLFDGYSFSFAPANFSPCQTGFMQGIDWQKYIENALKLQTQYMNALKNRMAALFQTGLNNTQNTTAFGYGNYNFNVTKMYTGSAADLDRHLKGVMAGKGAKLIELQNKYGINAAFMAALVNAESAHGTSNAARTKNNVAGIMSASSGYRSLAEFNSVDECLEAMAKNLSKNYVGQGRVTISQIHQKYCPIGAQNDPTGLNKNWGSTISQLTQKYELA